MKGRKMKLIRFLNENNKEDPLHIWSVIKSDVQHNYLKAIKEEGLLFRSSNKTVKNILKVNPRTDRKPLNVNIGVHNEMDKIFKGRFGWKARSEGVFVSADANQIDIYGTVYLFFPIGEYKFIWSPEVFDFYDEQENFMYLVYPEEISVDNDYSEEDIDYIKSEIEEKINSYTDKNLNKAIKRRNEIMFKCSSYYLVNVKYENIIINKLKDDIK
jgi:hypothetical protein